MNEQVLGPLFYSIYHQSRPSNHRDMIEMNYVVTYVPEKQDKYLPQSMLLSVGYLIEPEFIRYEDDIFTWAFLVTLFQHGLSSFTQMFTGKALFHDWIIIFQVLDAILTEGHHSTNLKKVGSIVIVFSQTYIYHMK